MDRHDQRQLVVIDQLQAMRQQEQIYQCPADYLLLSHSQPRRRTNHCDHSPAIPNYFATSQDRRAMCEWGYDIVDACDIDRRHVCVAISYFDRFMCTKSKQAKMALGSRRSFQLTFIACLLIALKCRAGMIIDANFVTNSVCQGLYEEEEIFGAEKEILNALQWRLNGPSAHDFVGYFVELIPAMAKMYNRGLVEFMAERAELYVEAAMLDYSIALQSPSSIAMAAVLSAMQMLSRKEFHPVEKVEYIRSIVMITGLSSSDMTIKLIRERLYDLLPVGKSMSRRISCDSVETTELESSDSSISSMASTQTIETVYGNVPVSIEVGNKMSPTCIGFES